MHIYIYICVVCISSSSGMLVSEKSGGCMSSMPGTLVSDESAVACCFSSAARDVISNITRHLDDSPNATELIAWEEVLLCGHWVIKWLVLCQAYKKKRA